MRYVLHAGKFKVELHLDEPTGQLAFEWDPHPPRNMAQFRRIEKAYLAWRNEILEAWAKRHGKKVLMIDLL